MAYDEYLADRIRQILKQRSIAFEEKKMMGGLCYMVDDKMCFGLNTDKKTDSARLMCRVGPENYGMAMSQDHCSEMNFTGRPMKGYVFVSAEGFDTDADLEFWIQLCLDYNPLAQSSKKRK
ncbi:TfoX/Sxy family protein [Pseudozobellia thermophila]|uniref:TfoX N-terminal domain-containing protein n=1 Tax=Pseudozobellia thermophila TaxID=192903 RepID=A0A1M6FMI1_9FLAO|nr:TfoX/Sxy family protein [Pseudozobellia thermophila]SHI98884.1 TfoX N-terminal domain-containing protein [Pseudozobellia thermophila]